MELDLARSKSRVLISRLFALMIVLLVLFTNHSFVQEGLLDTGCEAAGLLLLTLAAMGRLWALLYISGHKTHTLVTAGPYSIMRHPLYFFSFIGVLGIGLASENLLVLAVVIAFYLLYYPFIIHREEMKLMDRLGEPYARYMAAVPAFLPNLSLYQPAERYEVNTRQFVRHFGDALWFLWMFPLLHGIEALHTWGVLPVLWKLP